MKRVEKAFAYVTHGNRLLVFEHADFPDAGLQVPAGSIKPGESPGAAAVREAYEETGLEQLSAPRFLGTVDFDARPFGKNELHVRYFFHLCVDARVDERWRHYERDPSDGSCEKTAFDLYWLSLGEAADRLTADHGALLSALSGVRRAVNDDAEQLAQVYVDSLRDAYAGVMPLDFSDPVSLEQRALRFGQTLETQERTWLVATSMTAVVGFCGISAARDNDVAQDVGEVTVAAVAQSHRRQGYGSKLLAAANAEAVRRGWCALVVWVVAQNIAAQALYQKCGFSPDGAMKVDDRLGFPAELVRFRAVVRSNSTSG